LKPIDLFAQKIILQILVTRGAFKVDANCLFDGIDEFFKIKVLRNNLKPRSLLNSSMVKTAVGSRMG
jgi:hypothetical protein